MTTVYRHHFEANYKPEPGDSQGTLEGLAFLIGRDLSPDDPRASWIDTFLPRSARDILIACYHSGQVIGDQYDEFDDDEGDW